MADNVSAVQEGKKHDKQKIQVTTLQGFQRSVCRSQTNSHQFFDLPAEILREILKFLSLADQIRLSLTCKTSQFLPLCDDRFADRLPWLMTYGNSESDGFICKLFDFIHKKPYTTLQITGPCMESFRPDYVASKHGWLFLLREKVSRTAEMFLFCPYTKETIMLPDLNHGVQRISKKMGTERLRIVTFSSSDLKSKDTAIFVVYYFYNCFDEKVVICSYKHDDKGWKTKIFTHKRLVFIAFSNLVYLHGYLYCVNCDGTVGAYDVAIQRWYVFHAGSMEVSNKHGHFHLIVSNGMLLLSTLDNFWGYNEDPCCMLFSLDWSEMRWVRERVLKDQALFLGHQPWDCSFAVPAPVGDLRCVSNKIFHREGKKGREWWFYDFNKPEHEGCEGTKFEYFVPRKEESMEGAMWIEPPHYVLKPHLTKSIENLSVRKSTPNLSLACTQW